MNDKYQLLKPQFIYFRQSNTYQHMSKIIDGLRIKCFADKYYQLGLLIEVQPYQATYSLQVSSIHVEKLVKHQDVGSHLLPSTLKNQIQRIGACFEQIDTVYMLEYPRQRELKFKNVNLCLKVLYSRQPKLLINPSETLEGILWSLEGLKDQKTKNKNEFCDAVAGDYESKSHNQPRGFGKHYFNSYLIKLIWLFCLSNPTTQITFISFQFAQNGSSNESKIKFLQSKLSPAEQFKSRQAFYQRNLSVSETEGLSRYLNSGLDNPLAILRIFWNLCIFLWGQFNFEYKFEQDQTFARVLLLLLRLSSLVVFLYSYNFAIWRYLRLSDNLSLDQILGSCQSLASFLIYIIQ